MSLQVGRAAATLKIVEEKHPPHNINLAYSEE